MRGPESRDSRQEIKSTGSLRLTPVLFEKPVYLVRLYSHYSFILSKSFFFLGSDSVHVTDTLEPIQ